MYNNNTLLARRSAFSDGDLATASPARVLVKCFDRLDSDLESALTAIAERNFELANKTLGHAQDLLGEVVGMLDPTAWEHSDSLLAVYDYVLRLLAVANIEKLAKPVHEAQRLITEIGDGFRSAAQEIERRPQASAELDTPAPNVSPNTATTGPAGFDAAPGQSNGAPPAASRPGFSVLA